MNVAVPELLTATGARQVEAGCNVKIEPAGKISFALKTLLTPTVPPVTVAVSFTASTVCALAMVRKQSANNEAATKPDFFRNMMTLKCDDI